MTTNLVQLEDFNGRPVFIVASCVGAIAHGYDASHDDPISHVAVVGGMIAVKGSPQEVAEKIFGKS